MAQTIDSRRLGEAAEIVAERVRVIARTRSRRTAASVHVVQTDRMTSVVAGGPSAPMAAQFDPRNGPPGGRHPVFAKGPRSRWAWGQQPYFPFLEMGAEQSADDAARQYAKVTDDWAHEIGEGTRG